MTQGERLTTVETVLFGANGEPGFIQESRVFFKEFREWKKFEDEKNYHEKKECEEAEAEQKKIESKGNAKILSSKVKWLTTDRIIIILLALINVFSFVKGIIQ